MPDPVEHEPGGAYLAYKADPSPERLHAVVKSLQPTINYALTSIQSADDPVLKGQAHILAAKAIQSYDPAQGAALPTHVSVQLMPLRRMRRLMRSPVKVPERIQLDAFTLMRAEREFADQHGRQPDIGELADASKIPLRRIKRIQEGMRAVPSEAAFGGAGLSQSSTDYSPEALEYVYQNADHIDRRILEHKTGYGGTETLAPQVVATKLGLTPTQLSRRSARLAMKIQQMESDLESL